MRNQIIKHFNLDLTEIEDIETLEFYLDEMRTGKTIEEIEANEQVLIEEREQEYNRDMIELSKNSYDDSLAVL